jgi:SHS family lactate transporter-like MFS transporter
VPICGYSQGGMFPTYLQKEVGLSPAFVALPVMLQSLMFFLSSFFWGWMADRVGRRWALILPAIGGIIVTPFYLLTHNNAAEIGREIEFLTVKAGFGPS